MLCQVCKDNRPLMPKAEEVRKPQWVDGKTKRGRDGKKIRRAPLRFREEGIGSAHSTSKPLTAHDERAAEAVRASNAKLQPCQRDHPFR